jgi:hypothetical protein
VIIRAWIKAILSTGSALVLLVGAAAALAAGADRVPNADGEYRPGGMEAFADWPMPVQGNLGRITEVDFDGPTVTIDGYVYGFAADADIDLMSGFGAPTLLRPGMVVEFYYVEPPRDDIAGRIIAIYEVPEGAFEPT